MDPAIKKVAILLACALLVVIGLIVLTRGVVVKEVATEEAEKKVVQEIAKTEENKAPTAHEPEEEAKASQEDVTQKAPEQTEAQENEMYEGALAGLSEEEIAKLAMAEEESAAKTQTGIGAEGAVD